jgi:hypothetical protein
MACSIVVGTLPVSVSACAAAKDAPKAAITPKIAAIARFLVMFVSVENDVSGSGEVQGCPCGAVFSPGRATDASTANRGGGQAVP